MNQDSDRPTIRPIRPSDLISLVEAYHESYPQSPKGVSELGRDLLGAKWPDSLVQVIAEAGRPLGFGQAWRIPGLDRYYELSGCIIPMARNRGLGSRLMESILMELKGKGARMLTYVAKSEQDPGSSFLLRRGFSIEHQERIMELDGAVDILVEAAWPAHFSIVTYPIERATVIFGDLYSQIFRDLPWYQPYENEEQVANELADPADLLFLRWKNEDIGFCWTRQKDRTLGEIEPIGLLKNYRGNGLGKSLLLEGILLHQAQGISRIQIAAWEENQTAINLYRSCGFKRIQTIRHIGIDLQSKIKMSY